MRYFVSGHRDLTMEEFDRHYVYQLDRVLAEDPYAEFVVGDWEGCDTIFVKYMEEYYTDVRIHIFYVFSSRIEEGEFNEYRFHKRDNYDECDTSMTKNSDFDIAWIRPGREDSHTAKNIKRRYNLC